MFDGGNSGKENCSVLNSGGGLKRDGTFEDIGRGIGGGAGFDTVC